MCNVDIGHDPVVVPQPRHADVLRRAGIEGAELPDRIPVADLQARWLAGVLLVLRFSPEDAVLEYAVALADAGMPGNDGMRSDAGAAADLDMLADDGKRTDLDVRREPGPGMNDGARVDHGRPLSGFVRIVQSSLASETSTSSTSAWAENFQMPRMARRICTLSIRRSPGLTGFLKRASSIPTK